MLGMLRFAVPLLAVALLVSALLSVAHPADPPEAPFVRVLHDFNDDWGGHAYAPGGHDLVALDVATVFDEALEAPALVLRLTFDWGYAPQERTNLPELREDFTFTAGGADWTFMLRTSDEINFTGDFDHVAQPQQVYLEDGQPDGQRRTIDLSITLDHLGIPVGDKVTDFVVYGHHGTRPADTMGIDDPAGDPHYHPAAYTAAHYVVPEWTADGRMLADDSDVMTGHVEDAHLLDDDATPVSDETEEASAAAFGLGAGVLALLGASLRRRA